MHKLLPFLALLATASAQGDLDSIINQLATSTVGTVNKNNDLDLSPVTPAGKDLNSILARLESTAVLTAD